jgi:hypothetical protein
MGHSESGFFPEQAALIDPARVRGIVSIEMPCPTLTVPQISALAKIPILVMCGDHLGDVQGGFVPSAASLEGCQKFVQEVKRGSTTTSKVRKVHGGAEPDN